jgi:hypothetical protein
MQENTDYILLAKRNYKAHDGTIKEGILIDGKWYAPATNIWKHYKKD